MVLAKIVSHSRDIPSRPANVPDMNSLRSQGDGLVACWLREFFAELARGDMSLADAVGCLEQYLRAN